MRIPAIATPVSALLSRIREELRSRVEPERFRHILGVEMFSLVVAQATGVSREKAALAALLHDFAKNRPKDELKDSMRAARRYAPTTEDWEHPSVWHGLVAAVEADSRFGVHDPEVLDAVAFHPTGNAHLGPVGLVLFVADYVEPSRNYPGVSQLREEVLSLSLERAAARVANEKLANLARKGRVIHSRTQAMVDWLSTV